MIRTLLVKVMLALVRQDFATHAALTDELEKLVADPAKIFAGHVAERRRKLWFRFDHSRSLD